ncbi:GWxTD domain-containing protein [Stygiobacter electus]|uniref:GWxTD domain-containing protein n=1 Tax=Stygiobacter electus TaxID=3032292 RepID=A0AAE3NVN5_9BACT|nr:GWxTD domain-containing protein [Stygiobacter electus]MDF1610911.1 GWxTD domain-containing protein [Stygiobacter electus]
MKKIFFYFLLVSFNILFAQKELKFEFDFARFNYDTTSVYLEFYYELNPNGMKVINSQNGQVSEAIVHIEMKNLSTGEFFINRNWKIQSPISDSVQKTLSGVIGYVVPAGKYSLYLKAYDSQNQNMSKTIEETVQINPFSNEKYSLSDIELSNRIKKDGTDQNSIFYKNTLEVYPNPSMFYSDQSPVLFYYAELYNLKLSNPEQQFILQRLLFNSQGKSVYKLDKHIKQNSNASVEIGLINLSKYPTDTYNLVLSLIDPATNQAYVSSKRFYFYNPTVSDSLSKIVSNANLLSSEFAVYTNEECDKLFAQSKYIASKIEIDQYKKLDSLNAKREFLFRFWKNRDSDLSTERNEFKDEYMRRVLYANENFTVAGKDGYLSDRGRVYLIYGSPDQRDFYHSESNMKPYEIWFYNDIEGGVQFIFGDISGFGNYELLHSTKRGEVNDPDWERRLRTDN